MHAPLIAAMIDHETGVPHRIHHFLKVHNFARTIGQLERLDADTQFLLEAAAIVHDIGIRESLLQYQSADGPYQEKEGPPLARAMLLACGYAPAVIERVCFLVAHHHSYHSIDGPDYRILVEADFLVNLHEENAADAAILKAYRTIFKTQAGRRFCRVLFPVCAVETAGANAGSSAPGT